MAGFGFADEQPILFADGGGPDGVLDPVVVDLDAAVAHERFERWPLIERVGDRAAQRALWQVARADALQRGADAAQDHRALRGAHGLASRRTGVRLAQLVFDVVEQPDLPQQPADGARGAFEGLMDRASCVCPAAGQSDGRRSGASIVRANEGRVGAVAVGLQRAAKLRRDDRFQARGCAADGPRKEGIAIGARAAPKVSAPGLPVAGREVFDRRFVHLHVTAAEHPGADVFVDRPQPVGGQAHPLRHRLARDPNIMPRGEYLLLPVERQMIDVFADDDRSDQTGRADAAILQGIQRCDQRCGEGMIAPRIFAPHDAAAIKSCGLIVELPGHFLADAAPCLGAGFDRLGIDQLLDHRKVLRDARPALTRRARWGRRAPWCLRGHGLRGFSRRIESLQHQEQLRRIELFTLRAEEPLEQRIDLLAQQLVLTPRLLEFATHARQFPRRAIVYTGSGDIYDLLTRGGRMCSLRFMARSIRIEYPGAFYHVMARGNRREAIFKDDDDRRFFLKTLSDACGRTGWRVHAWLLMGNHYHMFIETPGANLVEGMKWLQNAYTRRFNVRHRLWGRLFGDRYKSVLVEGAGCYYETLADYIHLNPARAGLVNPAKGSGILDYQWSSLAGGYALAPGKRPGWLVASTGLAVLGLPDSAAGRRRYVERLDRRIVEEGLERAGIAAVPEEVDARCSHLRKGWYWGSRQFGERMLKLGERVLSKKRHRSYKGSQESRAHGEKEAARLLKEGMAAVGLRKADLENLPGSDLRKVAVASAIWERTTVGMQWINDRLVMKSAANASHQIRRMRMQRSELENQLPKKAREWLNQIIYVA